MTRFCGDSLSVRAGRKSNAILGKDRKKSMKTFLETGKHPLIEETVKENASSALVPLPTLDINRPHVFLNVVHQGREGHHTVKGTSFHKLHPQFAIYGGILASAHGSTPATAAPGAAKLQHTAAGLLSVHRDGSHFAITLGRALALDKDYVVLGRVGKGADVLEKLNDIPTDIEDAPEGALVISMCGTTDHKGQNDTLSSAQAGAASTADAVQATRGGLAQASEGVLSAVAHGLKRKGGADAAAAPAQRSQAPAGGGAAKRRKGARMGMLSDEDDDDSSDSENDS